MSDRVELPIVTEADPVAQHVSLLLIADGLRQAEQNLQEQEASIRKLSEQVDQLQKQRIGALAQRSLLVQLQTKIVELEAATKT